MVGPFSPPAMLDYRSVGPISWPSKKWHLLLGRLSHCFWPSQVPVRLSEGRAPNQWDLQTKSMVRLINVLSKWKLYMISNWRSNKSYSMYFQCWSWLHLGKLSYFTNLDLVEIAGGVPFSRLPFGLRSCGVVIIWPEDLFHFIGGSEVFFSKLPKLLSSWWFQLLWKLWRAPSKWGENLPRFVVCENSKNAWSFTTQIFMQFLPMAFGPLAIHLYHFCSLPLEVRIMWWPPWKWQEPLAMLGCYTAFKWRIIANPKSKSTKTYFLNPTHVSSIYKEICRIKKYREIYRTFSTKTLNGAMDKPQTQPISSDFKEAW